MQNDYIAPIDHSTGSAVASTASGAAGGALKGGVKGWFVGLFAPIILGAAIFSIPALIISTAVVSGAALGSVGTVAAWTFGMGAVGSLIGCGFALPAAGYGAVLGGLFGGVKGASRASTEVKLERGAAAEMQANVEAYKAQAQAMAQASNDNKYNLPTSGARMNPAASSIQADSAQGFGTIAGQQLQRA